MGVTEDLADDLARDVIKAIEATGDEDLATEIARTLGASSQTAEEAFLTAMRVRSANIKARALLLEKIRKFKEDQGEKSSGGATIPPDGDGGTATQA